MTVEQATEASEQQHSAAAPPAPEPPEAGQGEQDTPAAARPNTQGTADPVALRAFATRVSQENASIKKALGLPSTATASDISEALQRREASQPADERIDGFDPEVERIRAEAREDAWQYVIEAHGPEMVEKVRKVEDMARSGEMTPSQFTSQLLEIARNLQAGTSAGQAPPQAPPQEGRQPELGAPEDITPEGDGPAGFYVQPETEELGSGDVEGAASRMFARLTGNRR